jgi:hypothetical protein
MHRRLRIEAPAKQWLTTRERIFPSDFSFRPTAGAGEAFLSSGMTARLTGCWNKIKAG